MKTSTEEDKKELLEDTKSLAQWLGELKWLVFYDFRKLKCPEDTLKYNYTYERVNEYLARRGYRYIERSVFDRLKDEAAALKAESSNTVAQKWRYGQMQNSLLIFLM